VRIGGINAIAGQKPAPIAVTQGSLEIAQAKADGEPGSITANSRYYDEATQWDTSQNLSIRLSRNAWRGISLIMGLALAASLGTLWALVPLKSVEVVTFLVDKTTGFVEVAQPLERGGALSQKEAVLRANVVRFIRARETYDPKGLRDNFDLASLFSAGQAAKDLDGDFSDGNPHNLMKQWGPETTIAVSVKSVIFLNEQTAAVRFSTMRKSARTDPVVEHWVANVRFRYTSEPMRNDWRFDNPLGFQVFEYRRDQETVDTGAAQ
jgi:type IV secretion system protein VirB8